MLHRLIRRTRIVLPYWLTMRIHIVAVWLTSVADAVRGNLFFVPILSVGIGIAIAEVLLFVDAHIATSELPPFLRTTVGAAHYLLSAIATAIITVTGLVFSLVVVALQLSASDFSPRSLQLFFHSRLQQLTMGFMVGTFTYSLVVLHEVRSSLPGATSSSAVIPSIAIAGALVLGILAVIAIVVYVDRTARAMQVGQIIETITEQTVRTIRYVTTAEYTSASEPDDLDELPAAECLVVRARRAGWVQQAPPAALLGAIPPETLIRLETRVGAFVDVGDPLCVISPRPEHPELIDWLVRSVIKIGGLRTTREDVEFGLWQLGDIALRALSPGVNVSNTARDVITHLERVMRPMLERDLPPRVIAGPDGRRLARPHAPTREDYLRMAFAQIRRSAATQPEVAITLLRTLGKLKADALRFGAEQCIPIFEREASLLVDGVRANTVSSGGARASGTSTDDLERVLDAARGLWTSPDEHSDADRRFSTQPV